MAVFEIAFFSALASVAGLTAMDYRNSLDRFGRTIAFMALTSPEKVDRTIARVMAGGAMIIFTVWALLAVVRLIFPGAMSID
ncbi:hypothetical protein GCM10009716_47920 [Streptomyces sodiiphilus]|uniref:Uncharacterized protein n=1 Tax=Streptomyces sodiiphilus TaxID=226217 RepID=A0ABP5B7H1_9ACTN